MIFCFYKKDCLHFRKTMTSSIWDRFLRAQNPRDTFSCLKTYLTNPQSSQIITPNIIKKLYALISGFDCSDAPQPSDKVFIELRCLAAAALGKVSEMQDYVSMLIKHGLLKVSYLECGGVPPVLF